MTQLREWFDALPPSVRASDSPGRHTEIGYDYINGERVGFEVTHDPGDHVGRHRLSDRWTTSDHGPFRTNLKGGAFHG